MMQRNMEELAKIYGIEINQVPKGKGGLFFTDIQGNKYKIDNIFDEYNYRVEKYERIKFNQCTEYSVYSIDVDESNYVA